MSDAIVIAELELRAQIGVPDDERAHEQRLTATLHLEPLRHFRNLGDEIGNTVDYWAVCEAIKALARARPRRLLETLAEEIAVLVVARYAVAAVELELRKYILADTAFVAVRIRRER